MPVPVNVRTVSSPTVAEVGEPVDEAKTEVGNLTITTPEPPNAVEAPDQFCELPPAPPPVLAVPASPFPEEAPPSPPPP